MDKPSATPILHEVALALNVNPQIKKIHIEGHTDDRGSAKHNHKLSQKRAELPK